MRKRALRFGVILGFIFGMAFSGTASATSGGVASASQVSGAWPPSTWTGNFLAGWNVLKTSQDAVPVWKVTPTQVALDVQLAHRWADYDWNFGWTISFLNAAGNQVAVLPATGFVGGGCTGWSQPMHGPDDAYLVACRGGFYMVPITATQVRVNWRVSIYDESNGDAAQPFNVTRTVKMY